MKYSYAYKDSDGARHEDSIDAASREAVFAELRTRGIRPIKVVAADGSKANGELRGVRKRVVAALVACAALAVGAVAFVVGSRKGETDAIPAFEAEQTRRQVIGDTAVVEKGILTGWSEVFPEEGERFFASFAIPGVKAGQRNTTVEELEAALRRRVDALPSDGIEARQIKAMVQGMKVEALAYIRAGGTIVGYGRRLTERQDAEIAIYERAKADLERARDQMPQDQFLSLWEERNDQLRNLGIKLVPLE
ncbi:MAG: hypothetical protein IJ829_04435 [Kiritimatiellae bacterium]|nr:hypothetical protein [Kiritimatiellia bacterium]